MDCSKNTSINTSSLLTARMKLREKIVAVKKCRSWYSEEKNKLRVMALGPKVCQLVGDKRVFNLSELNQLKSKLNAESPLSWSVEFFSGGVLLCSSFEHIAPAIKFYVSSEGVYKISAFSYNINRVENQVIN